MENGNGLPSGEIKNGERTGIWKTFFPDGKLNEEVLYENNRCKYMNVWSSDGRQTVKNGNGQYNAYWDNDTVYMTGDIKNGYKSGIWITQNREGKLNGRMEYLDDELHGKIISFFDSGQISLEGEFLKGVKQGKWNWYNEDGSLSSTVQFENDKKEGFQLFYDMTGNPIKKEEYKNGELLQTVILN